MKSRAMNYRRSAALLPGLLAVLLWLLSGVAPALAADPLKAIGDLGRTLGLGQAQEEPFLDADQAFAFSAEVADADSVAVRWSIAPGYYLYRDKIKFKVKEPAALTLGEVALPTGEEKNDEFFGRIQVYHGVVDAQVPLTRPDGAYTWLKLEVRYQGCAEKGICYPPMTKLVELALPAKEGAAKPLPAQGLPAAPPLPATAPAAPNLSGPAAPPAAAPEQPLSEQDRIARTLAGGSIRLTVVTFFGFGLLLAFTPCVFPMIPILSSIIVGHGHRLSTGRAFVLSAVYVLAMALTYTVAGVVAALFGANLQAAFQNPWIVGAFAALFVALALSMFGFYDLQMPSFLQSRLTELSNRQRGGTIAGVAAMGLLSALIVGPCVAAPLAGALIYIGQTGDALLGGLALFSLSLGMGAPLVAIGTSAGKLLPRAGHWMDAVKGVFGVLLLGVAVYFLDRVVPAAVTMLLWALLAIVSAVYMGALEPLREGVSGWKRLWKGLGLALLVYGALLLIGAAAGSRDPLAPLHGTGLVGTGQAAPRQGLAFRPIHGIGDLERELAAARGRPVLLDFYADWCISCKELEKYTFSDPAVATALTGAVLLQADVTANNDADLALMKRLGVIGPPSIHFFGRDGAERKGYRVVGYMEAAPFKAQVEKALR